jgi:hypothetical protein
MDRRSAGQHCVPRRMNVTRAVHLATMIKAQARSLGLKYTDCVQLLDSGHTRRLISMLCTQPPCSMHLKRAYENKFPRL